MAKLTICCPGQPDQVLELADRPISIGRSDECSAFIGEKKASRKHLTVRLLPDGNAVAEDHGSSNGTWFVEAGEQGEGRRFLRRVLSDGDSLHIGDTTIAFSAAVAPGEAGGTAPVVSGTLQLTPASAERTATAPAPQPAAETDPAVHAERPLRTPPGDMREGEARAGAVSSKAMGRAIALVVVAIGILVSVEVFLGASAEKKAARKGAHLEALEALESIDGGLAAFQKQRDAFAARHPDSPDLMMLDRYLEQLGEREAYARLRRAELDTLRRSVAVAPRSELRFKLLQLRNELPDDEDFQHDIRGQLTGLDRRKAEEDMDGLRDLEYRVEELLTATRISHAARLVDAFNGIHDGMSDDAQARWGRMKERVDAALKKASGELWTRVQGEKDPAEQRRLLAQAWPALVGTKPGGAIADKLRSAASLAAPRGTQPGAPTAPGRTPGATPTPPVPTVSDALLARATKAEAMLVAREWVAGRAALAKLVQETDAGRLKGEWRVRLAEVDKVLELVQTLAEATDAERKPRRKLADGTWTVTDANPEQVTLESRKKGGKLFRWSELTPADVLVLLTPSRITIEQRHAVAVLAANLANRDAFVEALIPVYESGGDLAEADRLVARHLFGRDGAPKGGYRHYKGQLLDLRGYERRQTQERIAFLRVEADALLAKVAKEPALRMLGKMKALRTELDKRREYALLAIFNTTHYPYPANKGGKPYQSVQHEIDQRVKRVRELWDDTLSVRVKREGKLAKLLDALDLIVAELQAKKVDVTDLEKKIAPHTLYVTGEAITIRSFYRSEDERQWLAYCHWVIAQYNPARREVAKDSEHRQVQITNAYRMMMGYTAVVTPGPAPVDSINRDNVVQILDQATMVKTTPLRAVRIDNRLVSSARLHSEDMARRGYFAHQAPPNPATGEGPTGPANRMQKQGYHGWSYSENIAMSASPQQAHDMWCHSSGHHRNILSGWTDLGSGVGGRNFTQNFAGGGGARPEVYADTAIRERQGGGSRRRRRK